MSDSSIDSLRAQFTADLTQASSEAELRAVRDRYLARRGGLVSGLLKTLGTAPPDERPRLGQLVNTLKLEIETALDGRLAAATAARPPKGAVDVTLPGRPPLVGHRHPLSLLRERIEGIFARMGFLVIEGPELEDDYHNFEALNMPAEHPARDMQDTLYLASPVRSSAGNPATLLRTHTSGMQIRYMEQHAPPVRLIAPGRVYRRDNLDLTHTPMFTQVEGLVVGEDVTLADLKGTLDIFVKELFGQDRKVRFRPSFFPYTEPSAEVDISCAVCGGTGRDCGMCKRTGWIEILGSGMVHPAVFEAVGYDPEKYTGFAFGMGIERVALLKWGVEDIRLFYENDLRFLEQFRCEDRPRMVVGTRRRARRCRCRRARDLAARVRGRVGRERRHRLRDHGESPRLPEPPGDRARSLGHLERAAVGAVRERPIQLQIESGPAIPVNIDAPDLCPRYAAQLFDVTVGDSPDWLRRRLEAAGVRPINNVVDVTNYVMLEIGQPMHAFDLDRLAGERLVIRRARAGETLRTLDGIDRTLDEEMLVIADAERAVAIGGVMGGQDSEIGPKTTRMVLESACFTPASVRRTSKRLGLRTEASTRFERGTDFWGPVLGLAWASSLLQRIGAARPGPRVDVVAAPRTETELVLRASRIPRVLGMEVPAEDVERILLSLGFAVQGSDPSFWIVTVPTFRVDVTREVDLIEEVGRHYGFDKLPTTFPTLTAAQAPPDARVERDRRIRALLSASGLSESMTFAFIERDAALPFCEEGVQPAAIANPLSEKFAVLRPSLLPGLIDSCAHNRRRGRRDVRLFETGSRFTEQGEGRSVGLVCAGPADATHWSTRERTTDFYDVKGIVELVLSAFGAGDVQFSGAAVPYLAPGRAAVVCSGNTQIGVLGQLLPSLAERRGMPAGEEVYVAEIDMDALAACVAAARTARRVAAKVSGDHTRPVDSRRGSLACCCRSWHYPFGGP